MNICLTTKWTLIDIFVKKSPSFRGMPLVKLLLYENKKITGEEIQELKKRGREIQG